MTTEEYYHVFESIIYAAIVTQLLTGWYRILINWNTIKWYWAYNVFTFLTFILVVDRYYRFQYMEHFSRVDNTATFILIIIAAPAIFFILTLLLFPSDAKDMDQRQFMMERMRPSMIAMAFYSVDIIYRNTVFSRHTLTEEIPSFINLSLAIVLIIKPHRILFELQMAANFILTMVMIWISSPG